MLKFIIFLNIIVTMMFSLIIISFIPLILSSLLTFYLVKKWIKIAHENGFVGKDMNKYNKPEVAELGGLYVVLSIVFSLLFYIALKVYILKTVENLSYIFAITTILLLSALIGLLDDVLGWKKGLKHYKKVLITFILALPLMILGVGKDYIINIPFIGQIKLGLLYTLVLVPIGIVGAANAVNMIAGYNGLEASMLLVLFTGLFIESYRLGLLYISYISLLVIFSLIAFLYFNKYPAKVFPGNVFTYGLGGLYGALIILGNMETFGLKNFVLYFLELLLFIRGLKDGIYKENFGIPKEDNSLDEPYKKIYSVTHLAIRLNKKLFGKATENKVVLTIVIMQIIITIIALLT